jgi:hydrogenase-4 component F
MSDTLVPSILPALMFLIPALLAPLAWVLGRTRQVFAEALAVAGTLTSLLLAIALVPPILAGKVLTWWGLELRVDGLSCLVSVLIALVAVVASVYSIRYMRHQRIYSGDGNDITARRIPVFYALYLFFVATMLWGVTTNNIIMLYVSVEATTIASGLLVAFLWDKRALEAGYKYLMLLTVGITFALFGAVMLYSASTQFFHGPNAGVQSMLISQIRTITGNPAFPHSVMIFVVAFFIVGFGTKAGIAPFHPWLPDAHAEAPSPISALLSGVMIKMAVYALARTLSMFFPALHALGLFIILLGCGTMLLGITMALVQNDLKRLLAYSSVSQMGYILMGIGIWTQLGVYGGLFHLINHALAKALLFLAVGMILYRTSARRFDDMGGLAAKMPATAVLFFIGAFSISGIPPFNGFMSKLTIFAAGAQSGLWWAAGIGIFTSLLTMVVLVRAGYMIFWGEPRKQEVFDRATEAPAMLLAPAGVLSLCCLLLGVWPQSIYPLLHKAVLSLMGS